MGSLSIRNVRKVYHGNEILKGINLDVQDGEFLILVGPSGCGKSTLLSMIAGLDPVDEGEILIGGRRVNDLGPKDRDIAMMFQSYALYPNMSVARNISFGLEIRKVPRPERERIVLDVARILQIDHLLDRRPSQLSGGQRQRVAMGRAIARAPSLFLFDEPLSNLDARLRIEMRLEIKRLHQRMGTTIIYVTHDQIEAMTLGDKIAVMKGGEVQQFGTPQDIYDNPANRFVAEFMGSPTMNFIDTRLEARGGRLGVRLDADGSGYWMPVAGQAQALLASRAGQPIQLGIRPEQITHARQEDPDSVARLRVVLTEPTGPDTMVLVSLNGRDVTCRVHPDHAVSPGASMALQFDLSKAVYFDQASGLRVA
ncbi:ABC transporter ATP-binding protein [Castellaniella caeni]|uniref:ABC transporter ATP-binding protein n=1 Tax=Castellaniella caeni TaxID=266123 RepID=UPI0008319D01|nr:sn-glycerol-3-phosphate ABC transporter ATP-binding protein UgpC [Castellaniella caeni]